MSSTTIYRIIRNDHREVVAELRNSWGAAMRVWHPLLLAHMVAADADEHQRNIAVGRFMSGACNGEFWALARSPKLTRAERLVLAWTYDRAVVEQSRLAEMAELMREFDRLRPAPGANHLPAIAEIYDREAATPSIGLGVDQISVSPTWEGSDDSTPKFLLFEEFDSEAINA